MSQPGGSGGGGQAKCNADGQPKTIEVRVKSQAQPSTAMNYEYDFYFEDGSTVIYRIARNVKLSKLMHAYCGKKQLDFQTVRFIYEGRRVPGKYTADKVNLGATTVKVAPLLLRDHRFKQNGFFVNAEGRLRVHDPSQILQSKIGGWS